MPMDVRWTGEDRAHMSDTDGVAESIVREETSCLFMGALCALCADEDRAHGALYPPLGAIREISMHVAAAVAGKAYSGGVATELPRPHDLLERAQDTMYWPMYRKYR